jgi:hypothetical protein
MGHLLTAVAVAVSLTMPTPSGEAAQPLLLGPVVAEPRESKNSVDGYASDDSFELGASRRDSTNPRLSGDSPNGGARSSTAPRTSVPVAPSCDDVAFTSVGENSYYIDLNGCLHEDAARIGQEFLVTMPAEPGEPAEVAPAAVPIVVTAEDFQRLPINPGGLTVQPDRGWVLVNLETIVWTEAREQTFSAVVLGTPVQVRAEPIDFTWDFGDGSAPLVTTDPGAPFPNHSVAHVYSAAAEQRQVTLTTRWAGEFEVNGSGVWQPVVGVATTSEVSTFEVRTAETSLTKG